MFFSHFFCCFENLIMGTSKYLNNIRIGTYYILYLMKEWDVIILNCYKQMMN